MKVKEIQNGKCNHGDYNCQKNGKIEFISITPSSNIDLNEQNSIHYSNCESIQDDHFEGGGIQKEDDSDIDNIDFKNFKGIYFDDDPNRKYQDPKTGCHFEYYDLCKRLAKLKQLRIKLDAQLGLPPETPQNDLEHFSETAQNHKRHQSNQVKAHSNDRQARQDLPINIQRIMLPADKVKMNQKNNQQIEEQKQMMFQKRNQSYQVKPNKSTTKSVQINAGDTRLQQSEGNQKSKPFVEQQNKLIEDTRTQQQTQQLAALLIEQLNEKNQINQTMKQKSGQNIDQILTLKNQQSNIKFDSNNLQKHKNQLINTNLNNKVNQLNQQQLQNLRQLIQNQQSQYTDLYQSGKINKKEGNQKLVHHNPSKSYVQQINNNQNIQRFQLEQQNKQSVQINNKTRNLNIYSKGGIAPNTNYIEQNEQLASKSLYNNFNTSDPKNMYINSQNLNNKKQNLGNDIGKSGSILLDFSLAPKEGTHKKQQLSIPADSGQAQYKMGQERKSQQSQMSAYSFSNVQNNINNQHSVVEDQRSQSNLDRNGSQFAFYQQSIVTNGANAQPYSQTIMQNQNSIKDNEKKQKTLSLGPSGFSQSNINNQQRINTSNPSAGAPATDKIKNSTRKFNPNVPSKIIVGKNMSNIKIQGGILGAQLHLNQNIQNEQNKQSNSQNNLQNNYHTTQNFKFNQQHYGKMQAGSNDHDENFKILQVQVLPGQYVNIGDSRNKNPLAFNNKQNIGSFDLYGSKGLGTFKGQYDPNNLIKVGSENLESNSLDRLNNNQIQKLLQNTGQIRNQMAPYNQQVNQQNVKTKRQSIRNSIDLNLKNQAQNESNMKTDQKQEQMKQNYIQNHQQYLSNQKQILQTQKLQNHPGYLGNQILENKNVYHSRHNTKESNESSKSRNGGLEGHINNNSTIYKQINILGGPVNSRTMKLQQQQVGNHQNQNKQSFNENQLQQFSRNPKLGNGAKNIYDQNENHTVGNLPRSNMNSTFVNQKQRQQNQL